MKIPTFKLHSTNRAWIQDEKRALNYVAFTILKNCEITNILKIAKDIPKYIKYHRHRKSTKNSCSKYSRLPVIRTCTYSNNSVIRTEIAFPLDLLTQTQAKTLSVIRTFSYSNRFLFPLGPIVGEITLSYSIFLLLGDRRVRTLIFCD